MSALLSPELRELVESGPLAYLTTIEPDGRPQVTAIWIGLDSDTIVSGHMRNNRKLDNIRRDPRVVLSFAPPQLPGDWMSPYATVSATATVEPSDQHGALIDRLAKVYVGPDAEFPSSGPGFIVRYSIERVGGIGPWVVSS